MFRYRPIILAVLMAFALGACAQVQEVRQDVIEFTLADVRAAKVLAAEDPDEVKGKLGIECWGYIEGVLVARSVEEPASKPDVKGLASKLQLTVNANHRRLAVKERGIKSEFIEGCGAYMTMIRLDVGRTALDAGRLARFLGIPLP